VAPEGARRAVDPALLGSRARGLFGFPGDATVGDEGWLPIEKLNVGALSVALPWVGETTPLVGLAEKLKPEVFCDAAVEKGVEGWVAPKIGAGTELSVWNPCAGLWKGELGCEPNGLAGANCPKGAAGEAGATDEPKKPDVAGGGLLEVENGFDDPFGMLKENGDDVLPPAD